MAASRSRTVSASSARSGCSRACLRLWILTRRMLGGCALRRNCRSACGPRTWLRAMAESAVDVVVRIGRADVLAGRLWSHRRGGVESATFAYDAGYLARPDAYEL